MYFTSGSDRAFEQLMQTRIRYNKLRKLGRAQKGT